MPDPISTPPPAPQAQTPPSPLGVDPVAPPVATTPPAPPPATPPAAPPITEPPDLIKLDKAAYNQLVENAAAYGMILQEPQLAEQVMSHFRAKTGQVAPQVPQSAPQSPNPALDEVRRVNQNLVQRMAQMEIQQFQREHPDLKDYIEPMRVLIGQHHMDLQTAYTYAKAAKQQPNGQPASSNTPVEPVAEGRSTGAPPATDGISDIERRINDSKATPRIEDAMKLAWMAATQKVGNQS